MATLTLRRFPPVGKVFAPGEFDSQKDTVVEFEVGGGVITGVLTDAVVDGDGWGATVTLEVGTGPAGTVSRPRTGLG